MSYYDECSTHGGFHDSGSLETLVEVSMQKYSEIFTIKMACGPQEYIATLILSRRPLCLLTVFMLNKHFLSLSLSHLNAIYNEIIW